MGMVFVRGVFAGGVAGTLLGAVTGVVWFAVHEGPVAVVAGPVYGGLVGCFWGTAVGLVAGGALALVSPAVHGRGQARLAGAGAAIVGGIPFAASGLFVDAGWWPLAFVAACAPVGALVGPPVALGTRWG